MPEDKKFTPAKVFTIDDKIESRAISSFDIPVGALFEEEANVAALARLMGE